MSNYYYPPGAFQALCEIWDREAEADRLAAAVEEMIDEAKRAREYWLAEIIVDRIDKAPTRIYSLFAELVQAAVPSNPPYAYPEDEWPELSERCPKSGFLRAIPLICYELAEDIACGRLPADDGELAEARKWLETVDAALDRYAEAEIKAKWEAEREEAEIERGLAARESALSY